jgi:putative nucleotidyltransferase with HDIG domain
MPVLTLEQLVQYVQELPALPDVAVEVLKLTDDPEASARDVAGVISRDMSMTARVLKIANSAYYGMPRSVSTANEAVLILGMQSVRSLALAAGAYDTLRGATPGYNLRAGELWKHSISVAVGAQIIAKETKATRPEQAFVAGLLHDVGKVILSEQIQPQFQAILALVELDGAPFHEAERSILGFDHAEVGARVAERWNLPNPLCDAIGAHHNLDAAVEAPELAAVTHLANWAAHANPDLLTQPEFMPTISPKALEIVGVDQLTMDKFAETLALQADKLGQMMEPVGGVRAA